MGIRSIQSNHPFLDASVYREFDTADLFEFTSSDSIQSNRSLVPWRCSVKAGMAGKQGARGMMVRLHQSHNALRTAHYQSHNPKRIALDQGATPGDEADQIVSPQSNLFLVSQAQPAKIRGTSGSGYENRLHHCHNWLRDCLKWLRFEKF